MEAQDPKSKPKNSVSAFRTGTLCLVFLLIGYESALFVKRASTLAAQLRRDHPDTVYVVEESLARRLLSEGSESADGAGASAGGYSGGGSSFSSGSQPFGTNGESSGYKGYSGSPSAGGGSQRDYFAGGVVVRRNADHPPMVQQARVERRRVETFRFNPNTVSVEDLLRLGFSQKQAESIDAYRAKGGVFRRKSDFAKSYVVSDSVFRRLEPYIDIPRLDINKADSAAFDSLPGIGPYFAAKMVQFRSELGGYSCTEQLMHIWNFDQAKFDGLKDLIVCSRPQQGFELWTLPADKLREHPYIRNWQVAKAIVFFREHNPRELWTISELEKAGVITPETASKLQLCAITSP